MENAFEQAKRDDAILDTAVSVLEAEYCLNPRHIGGGVAARARRAIYVSFQSQRRGGQRCSCLERRSDGGDGVFTLTGDYYQMTVPKNLYVDCVMAAEMRRLSGARFFAMLAMSSAVAAESGPVVGVTGGQVQGATLEKGGAVFKEIPFAQPPIGDLRWRAPVSSTVIQAAFASPARSKSRASSRKRSWPAVSRRITSRFEIRVGTAVQVVAAEGGVAITRVASVFSVQ
jgi:hypothetical protein